MKPISVLHVVSLEKENYYLQNLAAFSERDEVDHSFVTFGSGESDFVRDFQRRGRKAFGLTALSRKNYLGAYRKLHQLYRDLDPDIVHTHLFDPSLIGLTVAKRQKRNTVLTRHHSDAVHQIASRLKRQFYLGLDSYISRHADHIIAPSRMVKDILVDWEGVTAQKVSIIPYGQTTERFDAVTTEKIEAARLELGMSGQLSLVCVSRLFNRKGHKYLFDAYAGLKNEGLAAKIYLVGDGEHRNELETAARSLGIVEDIRFLGWRDDALTIMAAADVVVHPSLEDALSSAVIESLMLEKPVIATDISGVRDSLGDGRFGKIVPPADADGFRNGLKEVLEQLGSARENARKGKQHLLQYMDARRVADEHVIVYRNVLSQ